MSAVQYLLDEHVNPRLRKALKKISNSTVYSYGTEIPLKKQKSGMQCLYVLRRSAEIIFFVIIGLRPAASLYLKTIPKKTPNHQKNNLTIK